MTRLPSRALACILAAAAVAIASLATGVLWPWLASSVSVLFFPAVMVVATYGGLGAGLIATLLSAASIAYFFMPPYWSFKVSAADLVSLLAFVAATALITSVANARRRAEDALRRASERSDQLYHELQASFARESQAEGLRQTERLKAGLLDALTHNLRTPLTAMKAAATALRADDMTMDIETRRELVEVIDEEVDRLNRFVGGLGSATAPDGIRSVDIIELMQAVRNKADILTQRHRLLIDPGCEVSTVEVDRTSIVEALYMVLENAVKYSRPGTAIHMAVARYDPHHARVTITDEGPGIPRDLHERVFERFFRMPTSGGSAVSGSGLGLSIARQLVTTQGGHIWIEDAPGGAGTSVIITLPTDVDVDRARKSQPSR
jgi:two-component system sensor histidine kinase KdpD